MTASVTVKLVRARKLAAVRREVALGAIGAAWKPALDQVWAFVRAQPGLWSGGHNVFVYRRSERPGAPLVCDFGVEVTRSFEPAGDVRAVETPEGEAAICVHRGPYDRMHEAYDVIAQWMAANHREPAGASWEIYGDPTPDPADTATTIVQLLQPPAR